MKNALVICLQVFRIIVILQDYKRERDSQAQEDELPAQSSDLDKDAQDDLDNGSRDSGISLPNSSSCESADSKSPPEDCNV